MARMAASSTRRNAVALLLVLGGPALGAVLAGCGSASPPSPPTGVDRLAIPTPDPDPADFVDEVDHPLLALEPGATWTYDDVPATRRAAEAGVVHDGLTTTVLVTVPGGDDAAATRDHLAQDRAGNVWWLGRQGPDDAEVVWFDEPGLFLPASPRRGDGYLMARAPGLLVTARVVQVDDVVLLDVVTEEAGLTRTSRVALAAGTGIVSVDDAVLVARDATG